MEKYLDITKPRHSEQKLPVLDLRYIEVPLYEKNTCYCHNEYVAVISLPANPASTMSNFFKRRVIESLIEYCVTAV